MLKLYSIFFLTIIDGRKLKTAYWSDLMFLDEFTFLSIMDKFLKTVQKVLQVE